MYGNEEFQSGLQHRGKNYLQKLLEHVRLDGELDDYFALVKAFDLLMKVIQETPNKARTITLEDLKNFGVERDTIIRLGRMIHTLVNNHVHGIDNCSNDYYENDFEEEEVEDEYDNHANDDCDSVDDMTEDPNNVLRNNFMSDASAARPRHGRDDEGKSSKESFYYGSINESITVQMKADSADYHESKGGDEGRRYLEQKNSCESIGSDGSYSRDFIEDPKPGMRQPLMTQSTAISLKGRPTGAASGGSAGVSGDDRRSVAVSAAGLRKSKQIAASSWINAREWQLGEKIGSGSFGDVYMGMNNKGKLFAVKKMNIKDKTSEVNDLISEIQMMRGLSHKHIVEYIGSYVDSKEITLYIFQQWVPGGSLAHMLKNFGPFPLGTVRTYTKQILLGLQYLHSNGIIHRDIKGGNILVDDNGTVKLADFGASTTLSQFDKTQETSTIKGTPYFMAPEVLACSKYGRKGDVWAVGCTMIQMLSGEPPWKDQNLKGLIQLHLLLQNWDEGPPPYKTSSKMTPEADECLRLCFVKNPDHRPKVADLLQCAFLADVEDESDDMYAAVSRSYSEDYSNRNSFHPHERLEDSGVISGLKLEMAKALAQSKNNKPGPSKAVDLQLRPYIPGMPSNSDDSNTGNTTNTRTEETVAGIDRQIQYRNTRGAYPDGPSTPITPITPRLEPKYSADIPLPLPIKHIYQVSNFSSDSQGPSTNQSSKNPFSRGAVNMKSNSSSVSASAQNSPLIPHISTDRRSDSYSVKDYTPPIFTSNALPRRSIMQESNAPDGMEHNELNVKEKLSLVKNKTSNYRASRQGNHSSQSSNRDSEDLTPLAGDNSDNEYDGLKNYGSAITGSSVRLTVGSSALQSHYMHRSSVQIDEDEEETQELNILCDKNHTSDRTRLRIQPLTVTTSGYSRQSQYQSTPVAASAAGITPRGQTMGWRCLNAQCGRDNSSNQDFCDYCAVVRGSSGRKGLDVVIQRKS